MTLPHAADPGGRNRQAALLQCLRHPHLAPGRLSGKGRELGMEPRHWSRRRSAAPARPVEPPQPGTESSLDSLLGSHERTRLGIEIPELAKNQVFRGFGMIPPSPNAVSLENRRGKMTSLRGRPVGLSGLKLSV